ncbi:MAG: hypothetical protein O7D95_01215 [Betaproteobacteria bacterium]|nr:hypothetical protein [Betaproteobacteria bacterium]
MILISLTQKTGVEIVVNMENVTSFIPSKAGTILRLNGTSPSTIEVKEDLEEVIKRIQNITHQRIERFK